MWPKIQMLSQVLNVAEVTLELVNRQAMPKWIRGDLILDPVLSISFVRVVVILLTHPYVEKPHNFK